MLNEWIIPYNPKFYNLEEALIDLQIIDWGQSIQLNNAKEGDIVYIYASSPVSCIKYKGAIVKTGKIGSTIDDRQYNIPPTETLPTDTCMENAVFREYSVEGLAYKDLKKHGLKSRLQGPCRVNDEVKGYLNSIDRQQISVDRLIGDIPPTCVYPFPIVVNENISNYEDASGDNYSDEEKSRHAQGLALSVLERIAIENSSDTSAERTVATVQRTRDPYIAEYTKRRANGKCQLCKNKAPFVDNNGQPYLESHHIKWLSKGGSDSINNTVALCPNCHKKMHILNDKNDVKKLMDAIK